MPRHHHNHNAITSPSPLSQVIFMIYFLSTLARNYHTPLHTIYITTTITCTILRSMAHSTYTTTTSTNKGIHHIYNVISLNTLHHRAGTIATPPVRIQQPLPAFEPHYCSQHTTNISSSTSCRDTTQHILFYLMFTQECLSFKPPTQ